MTIIFLIFICTYTSLEEFIEIQPEKTVAEQFSTESSSERLSFIDVILH